MDRRSALRSVEFLSALTDKSITSLADAAYEKTYDKGEVVFNENDPCMGLLIVLKGAVRIYKLDNRGRDLTLGNENPGSSVAELPLFDGGPYPACCEGDDDGTVLMIVPREKFIRIMSDNPEIAEHALKALASRMRRLVQMVEAQALQTVRVRLAAYLLNIASGRIEFNIEDTNDTIASKLGTVRDVISRTLGGFRESKIITAQGRKIVILDLMALKKIAELD